MQGKKPLFEDIESGRLGYYEHAGWVDWNHADSTWPKKWLAQIDAQLTEWGRLVGGGSYLLGRGDAAAEKKMLLDKYFLQIKAGDDLFTKLYAPSQMYWVKRGLSREERDRVALSILMHYSHLFETAQGKVPVRGPITSYSQEDLISNLLGFYAALLKRDGKKGTDREVLEPLLGKKVSPEDADQLWRKLGGNLGANTNKNYQFVPKDHNPTVGFGPMKWPPPGLPKLDPLPEGDKWGTLQSLPEAEQWVRPGKSK